MGDIESLSSHPHYWKSCLVPHLLIGKIDCPDQLAQGWSWHQSVFSHSDLGVRTDGKHSLLLLTTTAMLLHPFSYAEIPNKPWNPMLASVNPVNSAVPKSQPSQPDNPEAWVYGSKAKMWPYGLFPSGHMGKRVRVPYVYNYSQWVIWQLTINELATVWDVPLFLQDKLEELDKKSLLVQFLFLVPGKTLLPASDYLISSRIRGGEVVLNATHISEGGGAGHSDPTNLVNPSAITLTNDEVLRG